MQKARKKVVITSGYFNPLHIGHIKLIKEARALGDFLIVVVNNDNQVKIKGSVPFMDEKERLEIIKSLKYVDSAILSLDKNTGLQQKTLEFLGKKYKGNAIIFAKGGDWNKNTLPEPEKMACEKYNIEIVDNVGGGKIQSSSWLIKNAANSSKP